MHTEQKEYCQCVLTKYPQFSDGVRVLDVGSLDINWNNRYLFRNLDYTGIDIGEWPNVDVVCDAKDFDWDPYDVVISTEMLEHNKFAKESVQNMVRLLKSGGLLLITCAWPWRPEHGTTRTSPQDAPFTNDYYRNVSVEELQSWIDCTLFSKIEFSFFNTDTRVYWIKL